MTKQEILSKAYRLRYNNPNLSLGQCIRMCSDGLLDSSDYGYLSKLDGLVAEYQFNKIMDTTNEKGS
jgi:hypothetical protein